MVVSVGHKTESKFAFHILERNTRPSLKFRLPPYNLCVTR